MTKLRPRLEKLLWSIVCLLVFIGVAIVVRRTLQLMAPSPPPARFPEAAAMDAGFTQHRLLTMIHMAPGLLFMLLGPFQFMRGLRNRRPALHRWMGRVFLVSGLIVGITALVMSPQMAIGGATETAATTVFATILLVSLIQAYVAIRRRNIARHREWMIRAFAIGLAVSTVRPIVGVFFATRAITHLTAHDFFGIAFWLGFTLHLVTAEVWIRWREV